MAMKVFVCGLGKRARSHVESLDQLQEYSVTGGYDPAPGARESAAQWPMGQIHADLAEGLSATQPDCILISTPPQVRLQLLRDVIDSPGLKAVIVEKPLAVSRQEAVAMYDLCQARKVELVVAHQLRYSREFVALKEAVSSGRLGSIRTIQAGCYGKLFDQGSHMVDLIRWLDNDSEVAWADATACDDLSALAAVAPIPPDFTQDPHHPGQLWSSITLRLKSDTEAFLGCGLLDAMPEPALGPWLQKRIIVTGTEGVATAHVASHFREISTGLPEANKLTTNVAEYEQALNDFYRELAAAMASGRSLQQRDDNLHTLDTLLAALRSANAHCIQAVTAVDETVAAEPQDTPDTTAGPRPKLSVIMPMEDHRGLGQRAVESWTLGQRCALGDFELIVLIDRHTKDIEDGIRRVLRPQDQLIYADMENEMAQYHHGATLARSEVLLFTEPHCIAEPQAVDEINKFFANENADGLCVRSTPIADNRIAEMESRMYDEGFADWSRPDHWAKVIVRGFGIRKKAYFDAGGYDLRYDRFAEWLLAATLRQRGVRLLYAPGAGMAHLYSDNFRLLEVFIKEFTDGECKFRLETDDTEFCYRFFEAPAEWTEARAFRPALAQQAWRNLWQVIRRRRPMAASLKGLLSSLLMLLRAAPLSLLGRRYLLASYRLPVQLAKLRFYAHYFNPEKQYQDFLDFYMGETALCRVKMALAHPAQDSNGQTMGEIMHYRPGEMADSELYGFHPEEHHAGDRFRWSGPLAAMRLSLPPGNYSLTLKLLSVRKLEPDNDVAFFLNDRFIEEVKYSDTDPSLCLRLNHSHFNAAENWLCVICRPWRIVRRPGHDERELGLPLKEITVTAA